MFKEEDDDDDSGEGSYPVWTFPVGLLLQQDADKEEEHGNAGDDEDGRVVVVFACKEEGFVDEL